MPAAAIPLRHCATRSDQPGAQSSPSAVHRHRVRRARSPPRRRAGMCSRLALSRSKRRSSAALPASSATGTPKPLASEAPTTTCPPACRAAAPSRRRLRTQHAQTCVSSITSQPPGGAPARRRPPAAAGGCRDKPSQSTSGRRRWRRQQPRQRRVVARKRAQRHALAGPVFGAPARDRIGRGVHEDLDRLGASTPSRSQNRWRVEGSTAAARSRPAPPAPLRSAGAAGRLAQRGRPPEGERLPGVERGARMAQAEVERQVKSSMHAPRVTPAALLRPGAGAAAPTAASRRPPRR